jgi:hypothetical protein
VCLLVLNDATWCLLERGPVYATPDMELTTPPLHKGRKSTILNLPSIPCDLSGDFSDNLFSDDLTVNRFSDNLFADDLTINNFSDNLFAGDQPVVSALLQGPHRPRSPVLSQADEGSVDEDNDKQVDVDSEDSEWTSPVGRESNSGPGDIASDPDHEDAASVDNDGPDDPVPEEKKVRTCHCQSIPNAIPQRYTPPCLPTGALLATREIQMFPEFRANLLGVGGVAQKTQTMRVWGPLRSAEHHASYTHGRWIRVWRGQGHKDTIGWLLITHWDTVLVRDITRRDCVREGRPKWLSAEFKKKYFNGLTSNTQLTRIQFVFHRCLSILE